jgi:maltose O-acetyltransferase
MKTEKEKMLAGEMYDPADPELLKQRENARRLVRLINQSTEKEGDKRISLLKELFGSTGDNLFLEPAFDVTTATISMWAKTFLPTSNVSFLMYAR